MKTSQTSPAKVYIANNRRLAESDDYQTKLHSRRKRIDKLLKINRRNFISFFRFYRRASFVAFFARVHCTQMAQSKVQYNAVDRLFARHLFVYVCVKLKQELLKYFDKTISDTGMR